MAKKRKKQTSTVHLSPSKYIQTKARQLPVMECLVNTDWAETKMANITIARSHSNGNITFASYLVDLLCMGVKDSDFQFNTSPLAFDDFKKQLKDHMDVSVIDYTLAHNIIFAGYEFAIELGIDPCKSFLQTTQFMLEEDNDNVELIDIECGQNGLPVVIRGDHNTREADETYRFLCDTIGEEKVILSDVDEALETEDPFYFEAYLYDNPIVERRKDIQTLERLTQDVENISREDSMALDEASNRLFYNYYGYEQIDENREHIMNLFDVDIAAELPDRVLGFKAQDHPEWLEIVNKTIDQLQAESTIDIKSISEQYPHIPYLKFICIKEMEFNAEAGNGDTAAIVQQLKTYMTEHPDYLLLKLIHEIYLIKDNEQPQILTEEMIREQTLGDLFGHQEAIHSSELMMFVLAYFEYLLREEEILTIDSLITCLDYSYSELRDSFDFIRTANVIFKLHLCQQQYLK